MVAYKCMCMLNIYLINEDVSAKAGLTQRFSMGVWGKKIKNKKSGICCVLLLLAQHQIPV